MATIPRSRALVAAAAAFAVAGGARAYADARCDGDACAAPPAAAVRAADPAPPLLFLPSFTSPLSPARLAGVLARAGEAEWSGVTVSPASGAVQRPTATAATEAFQVTNTGAAAGTFALSTVCSGSAVSQCALSTPASIPLAAGASAVVAVNYRVGATAALTGSVGVQAVGPAGSATGSLAVTTVWQGKTGLIGNISSEARLDRGDCLTVALAPGADYQCGDLRLVHAFPGVRAMNRASAPALVYSSSAARPYLVIGHTYSPPAGATPTTVTMKLSRGQRVGLGGPELIVATSVFPGWAPGVQKRISVGLDISGYDTGAYPYSVHMIATYADGTTQTLSIGPYVMAIVNRGKAGNPWGLGWWMGGVEQLAHQPDGSILWIGSDGSPRHYRRIDASTWAPAPYDRPDTIKLVSGEYVRALPNRAEVRFDLLGQHVATVSKTGQRTNFDWSSGKLTAIHLPGGQDYTFAYAGCAGTLSGVTAPGGRTTAVGSDCTGRVTSFTDPGLPAVVLGYDGATQRVASRTDRRGYRADFRYDAASRISSSKRWMGLGATGDSAVITIRAQESQGLLVTGGAVDIAGVATRIDGPRPGAEDTTRFVIGRWGAPTSITDPYGNVTTVSFNDGRWPGRATRVLHPNGREMTSVYDHRGRVVATTDWGRVRDGRAATRIYEWDATFDLPARVVEPEGESVTTTYDAYGRPDWIQLGGDTMTRTRFTYVPLTDLTAPGQVATVKSPLSPPETFEYDARGNLSARVSPLGFRTEFRNDDLGRVRRVRSPLDSIRVKTDSTDYDAMGRDTMVLTTGPATSGRFPVTVALTYATPAMWTRVSKRYDDDGNLRFLTRSGSATQHGALTTQWEYDALSRVVRQTEADLSVTTTTYMPSGDSMEVLTRRGHRVATKTDLMGRVLRRWTPAVHAADEWTPGLGWSLPRYTNGFDVPAALTSFTYDAMGNLRTARNPDAGVTRVYNADGSLAADSLWIRSYAGNDTTSHRYGTSFGYDLAGRRLWMKHPRTLAPRVAGAVRDSTAYEYDAMGQLTAVVDPLGNRHVYRYDAAGRIDSVGLPGGLYRRLTYDGDGRLTRWRETATQYVGASDGPLGATIHDATLTLLSSGSPRAVEEWRSISTTTTSGKFWWNGYNGLGGLSRAATRTAFAATTYGEQAYAMDGLGSTLATWRDAPLQGSDSTGSVLQYFADANGRLREFYHPGVGFAGDVTVSAELNAYDAGGNRTRMVSSQTSGAGMMQSALATFLDADNRVVAVERRTCQTNAQGQCTTNSVPVDLMSVFEEFRYDPLGRRVLVRTRADSSCVSPCQSAIKRTVWDGDHVLYEIRMPGSDADAALGRLENDTLPMFSSLRAYGRVAYTNGVEIDRPLGIIRIGHSPSMPGPVNITPLYNWRGLPDQGAFAGKRKQCANPAVDSTCVYTAWPAADVGPYLAPYAEYFLPLAWNGDVPREQRDASGMVYMRNRYYDPGSGQFVQEDPVGLGGGLNLYGYAGGNPLSFRDPYGLCPYAGRRRTTNLNDCPTRTAEQRTILEAFRILEADGQEGKDAIRVFVDHGVDLTITGGIHLMGRCDSNHAQGCYDSDRNRINVARSSAADMAVRLVHETTHILYAFPNESNGAQSRMEEQLAWDRALRVYARLRNGQHGKSQFYEPHFLNHCAAGIGLACQNGP